jgi:hypothetical protein
VKRLSIRAALGLLPLLFSAMSGCGHSAPTPSCDVVETHVVELHQRLLADDARLREHPEIRTALEANQRTALHPLVMSRCQGNPAYAACALAAPDIDTWSNCQ